MGAVGQWRVELQGRAEYADGAAAFGRGEPRHCFILTGDARQAWLIGWDDARDEAMPRVEP